MDNAEMSVMIAIDFIAVKYWTVGDKKSAYCS
jgi:hypothetical protein